MTLYDQIIDEAEQLTDVLQDASDTQIVDAVSDIVQVKLGYNSIGAKLALAAFHRMNLKENPTLRFT